MVSNGLVCDPHPHRRATPVTSAPPCSDRLQGLAYRPLCLARCCWQRQTTTTTAAWLLEETWAGKHNRELATFRCT